MADECRCEERVSELRLQLLLNQYVLRMRLRCSHGTISVDAQLPRAVSVISFNLHVDHTLSAGSPRRPHKSLPSPNIKTNNCLTSSSAGHVRQRKGPTGSLSLAWSASSCTTLATIPKSPPRPSGRRRAASSCIERLRTWPKGSSTRGCQLDKRRVEITRFRRHHRFRCTLISSVKTEQCCVSRFLTLRPALLVWSRLHIAIRCRTLSNYSQSLSC